MQTDVLASIPITASGQFTDQATNNIGRCRIKSIYIVPGASAGSLVLRDGGASSSIKLTVNTVAYVEKFRWWGTRLIKLRNAEVPLGIECGAPVRQHPGYNYLPNVTVPGVIGAIVGRCEVPVA